MADDIVISARVDTTEAMRDLAKLEQDRTVDVEVQPVNVDATIKAIDQRLSKLNTQLVIAVAEDNTKSVKTLQAKIDGLTRRKTQLTIEVDADTRGATAAIDRAAQDQTATVRVEADTSGLDALIGGLGNLPGVGGLDSALSSGGGGGLSGLLSGGAVGGATKLALAGGAIAGSFALAATSVGTFVERGKEIERLGQIVGTTSEETSRLLAVTKRYGAEMGDVADVLLNIQGKAADGSLGDFGVELDADGSALDNLGRVADAYAATESAADKAALASAALGEEGARQFVPIIEQGADEMERLFAAVDGGQVFSDEDVKRAEELREVGVKLGETWESVQISIGGWIADLIDELTPIVEKLTGLDGPGDPKDGPNFYERNLDIGGKLVEGLGLGTSSATAASDKVRAANAKAEAENLDEAADGAVRLGGELEEAKTQAELLEDATAAVKNQINSAIDPFAELAAGDQGVAAAVEGLNGQRDALTDLNDKIDEAKGKQAELREQLAETDDDAKKAAESRAQVETDAAKASADAAEARAQVATDAAKAAADADEQRAKAAQDNAQRQVDAEESRAEAVEDAARRIAEVAAKEAKDAAGAQARLVALTRQRNELAADGDAPDKVRDLDNQIAVTKRDMSEAKGAAADAIAETNRKLAEQQADIAATSAKGDAAYAEQVARINQAQGDANAKSAEALAKISAAEGEANAKSAAAIAKIDATEAEGLAKAAERRAALEADLAELESQAGIELPVGLDLSEMSPEKIAEIQAAFPELEIPTKIDTDAAVAKLAQAVASDVSAEVDAGLIPLDEALDETVERLQVLKAEQVAIGVDPSTLEAFDTIIGKLQETQGEIDKLAGKAAAEAAARSGLGEKGAEAVGETARAEAKISVTLDDDQAVSDLAKITGKQPDADVAVKTPGADAAEEKVATVAKDRTATITVEARGLRPILDQLAQIQDKTITITVNEAAGLTFDPANPFGSLPGNWAGGTMQRGGLARVAEHGPEVFEGRSGQRLVLRGDGAFRAPEAGRVVSGAETARRYPHLVGGAARTRPSGDVYITNVSPDARLAFVDDHRGWTRIMGGKS
jgi:hypothetical protein